MELNIIDFTRRLQVYRLVCFSFDRMRAIQLAIRTADICLLKKSNKGDIPITVILLSFIHLVYHRRSPIFPHYVIHSNIRICRYLFGLERVQSLTLKSCYAIILGFSSPWLVCDPRILQLCRDLEDELSELNDILEMWNYAEAFGARL